MRIITLLFIIALFFNITGCSKSEQPGNNSPKSVWKTPLLEGKESFTLSPIIYKDLVIYGSKYALLDHNEKLKILAFNKHTGEKTWEWNEVQSLYETLSASNDIYINGNILTFSTGARVYAIDMDTGKSLWMTKEPDQGLNNIVGIGNTVYHVRASIDKKRDVLLKADISNGNWVSVFVAEQQSKLSLIKNRMLLYKDNDGENYLYFTYSHTDLQYTSSEIHLVKLNVRTDSIIFNRILSDNQAYSITAINDKGIYLAGGALKCFSKNTGEFIKAYDLPVSRQNYTSGQCIIHGNKLFAPTDFPKLICYDIDSGNTLWSEDGLSTSLPSRLIYHDGIIYYTSSSDGFLHAIDENGKRYWKFQSPDRKGSGNGIFDSVISIDAAENRIYVSSYYNALCYETIKK